MNFIKKGGILKKNQPRPELFEDNRKVARKYIKNTRLKILKFIPREGKHFLDFASDQYNTKNT